MNNVDWCQIYKAASETGFVKMILDDIVKKTTAGAFLGICGKTGEFKGYNISMSGLPFFTTFPNGDYKVIVVAFNDFDNLVMNLTFTSRLTHK